MTREERRFEREQAAMARRAPESATHILEYSPCSGWYLYPVSWLTAPPPAETECEVIDGPCGQSDDWLAKRAAYRLGHPVTVVEDGGLRARLARLRGGDHHPAYWVIPS